MNLPAIHPRKSYSIPDINSQSIDFPENTEETSEKIICQLAKNRLERRAKLRNQTKDKNKRFITYQPGQQVLIKEHRLSSAEDKTIHKFFLLYRGPYTITEIRGNNTVTIELEPGQTQVHNMKNVKLYVPPDHREAVTNTSQ